RAACAPRQSPGARQTRPPRSSWRGRAASPPSTGWFASRAAKSAEFTPPPLAASVKPSLNRRITRYREIRESRSTEVRTHMPAAEIHVLEETELERVEQWRAEELERGGYKPA